MSEDTAMDQLDRHALASAIWLGAWAVGLGLFHFGFTQGGPVWVLAGFGALLAGYAAHIVMNAALGTGFTTRELALALVLYGAAGLALVLAVLMVDGFAERYFLPVALGLAGLAAVVLFYLVSLWGPRQALAKFDVIRDNNPRKASRLPHRGGRE